MRKHPSPSLACLLILTSPACGRTDLENLVPADEASDAGTMPPSGADGGTGSCSTSFEPRVIGRFAPPFEEPSNGWLALGPEGAYFVRRDPQDGAERLMLLRSRDGRTTEQARALRLRLIDADESVVVTVEQDLNGRVPSIVVRGFDRDSERRIPTMDLEPYPAFPTDMLAPTQLLDQGRLAIETMSYLAVQTLDGSGSYDTLSPGRSIEPPVLRWPYLASTSGGMLTVWNVEQSWASSQWISARRPGYTQIGIMESEWIGLIGSEAIRGPLPPSQGDWQAITDLSCFSAHTDGRRAVFACAAPPLAQPNVLVTYDGANVETYDLDEEYALLARISGRFVATLSYPEGTELCDPSARGEVVIRDLERGERRVLATVSSGCLCCDAYWPLPALVFEDQLLSWTYDVSDVSKRPEGPSSGGIGLGRVGPPCD